MKQAGRQILAQKRQRGFSLPEMLVVLAIIAIATTVAALAYSNYRKGSSVRGLAWEVQSVLTNAKTRAIARNLPSRVVFDLENQSFWIDDLDESLAPTAPKVIPPKYLPVDVVIDSVKINSTELVTGQDDYATILFRPDGSNPYVTVYIRGVAADATVDENFYSVQLYPSSAEPKIWPNARKN